MLPTSWLLRTQGLLCTQIILLARITLGQEANDATCYFANGTALPNLPDYRQFQPCSGPGLPGTICCGVNRTNDPGNSRSNGFTRDECLPNGLCQNRELRDGREATEWWVNYCTSRDVASGDCLDVCHETKNTNGNTKITPCTGRADSERWCCGTNTDCCISNIGVVMLARVFGQNVSNTALPKPSSTSRSSASNTFTTSATSTPPPLTEDSKLQHASLSGGAIAGTVVGVVAGIALLAAAVFFARRAAQWKKKADTYASAPPTFLPEMAEPDGICCGEFYDNLSAAELPMAPPAELHAQTLEMQR